ncbi:sugar ABC transporter substrate-binding protein [Pseudoxanthomonas sp. NC8]|nr:sugar ABC transporter substrate-binding protein [Pseudoxanthomonas sp. NC8]
MRPASRSRGLHLTGRRVAVLLLAGLAAGCREQAAEPVRFWAIGREAEVVTELVAQFERENPGIRVEVQQIPGTAAHEKLLTAYAADALPDLCQLGNTLLPEFAALGVLEPLQPMVEASAVVAPEDYFPGVWETSVIDGKLVGVPWYVDTRLLFYRKDILREAGVEHPPRTWAEWEQAMAAVKARVGPDRYAILMPLNEFEQLVSFGLQQDDSLLRDHDTRGNFQSPGFRRAMAFYANMFARGWAPRRSETEISNVWDEFFNGFYAYYLSGPWNIREFRKREPAALAGQWGTMPLPGPEGPGAGIAGGASLIMFRGSPRQRQAWKLVEFLSRPDVQVRFHAMIGNLPPRRSSWSDPQLAGDALSVAFRDQMERIRPVPRSRRWERIAQEIRITGERVVRGGQPQEQALRELDQRVDAILEKRRWMRARDSAAAGPGAAREVAP